MPIIKADNFLDAYRQHAASDDIHRLSGRTIPKLTAFVNTAIAETLDIRPGEKLVDIGCGDGSLLAQLVKNGVDCVGIAPTQEEVDRLRAQYAGIDGLTFERGLAQDVGLSDQVADVVICNGVLILLDSWKDGRRALREMYRIVRPGGRVWVGEVPHVDEMASRAAAYGDSIGRWLLFVLRNSGTRAFLGALQSVLKSALGKETFVVQPKRSLWIAPEDFCFLAEDLGFSVDKQMVHQQIDGDGRVVPSPTRHDFLLLRP